MARFEPGIYAQVIATGRIGEVTYRERTKVTVEFFDKSSTDPEMITFKDYELKVVELPRMKTSQLRPFVRGEITLFDITNGVNILPEFIDTDVKAYKISVDDLYAGVKSYSDKELEDVYRWIDTLILFEDEIAFPTGFGEIILDAVKEKDILSYAYDILEDTRWDIIDEVDADAIKKHINERVR